VKSLPHRPGVNQKARRDERAGHLGDVAWLSRAVPEIPSSGRAAANAALPHRARISAELQQTG
jgi:hypothetical protein